METGWRRNYLRYKSFFLNMMSQYRERSDWKAYLEILLSLATVSIFSLFALRPTILTIAELIKQIEEKKATVAKMDEKIQNIGKAQVLFDHEGSNLNLLTNSVIPTTPNSDIFARQLEALSSKHGVVLTTATLGQASIKGNIVKKEDEEESEKENEGKSYSEMKYSFNVVGDINQYEALLNFTKDFNNLRIPTQMSTLDISIKEEVDQKTKVLVLLIEGKLPYLRQNK